MIIANNTAVPVRWFCYQRTTPDRMRELGRGTLAANRATEVADSSDESNLLHFVRFSELDGMHIASSLVPGTGHRIELVGNGGAKLVRVTVTA